MRRLGFVGLLICAVGLGSSALAASPATSPTQTPPTTVSTNPPGSTSCTEGVTFKSLKRGTARRLVVKADLANIRALPGLGCNVVLSVERGKRLRTTGQRARADKAVWLEVKGKFGRGWIYEGLVRDA